MKTTQTTYPAHSLQKKAAVYYAVVRWHGKPKWLPTFETDKTRAGLKSPGIVMTWIDAQRVKEAPPAPLTEIQSDLEDYLKDNYNAKTTKPSTRRSPVRELGRLLKYSGVKSLKEMDYDAFDAMTERFKESHSLNPVGLKIVYAIWKSFFKWAVENGKMPYIPVKKKKHQVDLSEVTPTGADWEEDEFPGIYAVSNERDKNVLTMAYETGIYPADIYQITVHNITTSKGKRKLFKRRAKSKAGKTPHFYDQPLTRNCLDMLDACIADLKKHNEEIRKSNALLKPSERIPEETKVFFRSIGPSKKETSFGVGVAKRLEGYWKKAFPDRPSKRYTDLRHHFVSRHAERGVPIHIVAKWIGHSVKSQLLITVYLHIKDDSKWLGEPE